MTDFVVPTDFVILGGDDDLGSSQIRPGKAVGGGAVDETDTWLKNARFAWAHGNRAVVAGVLSYGADTPQAVVYSTTSTTYVLVYVIPIKVALSRTNYTVTTDSEQCVVKYELRTSGGTSRGSVETNAGSGVTSHVIRDDALTDSTGDTAYLEVSVKAQSGQTGKLYGFRVFEDASTL